MDIALREWNVRDAHDFAHIVNNSDMRYMRRIGDGECTERDAECQLKEMLAKKNIGVALHRAILLDGMPIGHISVTVGEDIAVHDGSIGYYLMERYTGQGIMTRALELMVREAFLHLNIVRITAYVAMHNIASIKVLEHCGFIREGLLHKGAYMNGVYEDVVIYTRFRE